MINVVFTMKAWHMMSEHYSLVTSSYVQGVSLSSQHPDVTLKHTENRIPPDFPIMSPKTGNDIPLCVSG